MHNRDNELISTILKHHGKVAAIRVVRALYQCGLAEGKDHVEYVRVEELRDQMRALSVEWAEAEAGVEARQAQVEARLEAAQ